jgi:dolichyl-diphosphooligosaccharide--protein glycosyltransferase
MESKHLNLSGWITRRKLIVALLLIAPAILIRLQNLSSVFSSTFTLLPRGFDPYYHMRLAEVIVKSGYRPGFDSYLNYPYGLNVGWPPLFDYILALPGLFFGFRAVEVFAAFLPVILGLISTVIVYLIAKRFIDNVYFAALSAFLFTLTPRIVYISLLGFCDHHIWIVTLLLAATYFALDKGWRVILSGIFLAILAVSWLGSPIYAAVLALALFMYKKDESDLGFASLAFAIPAVVSFVSKPFIAFSFLALAAFLAAGIVVKKIGEGSKIRYVEFYYVFACVLTVVIGYLMPSAQLRMFKSGVGYLLGEGLFLPTIAEAQSFQFIDIVSASGYFTFPLALIALLFLRDRFLISWLVPSLALSIFQLRFTELLALPVPILAAYITLIAVEKAGYPIFEAEKVEEKEERRSKDKAERKKEKDSRKRAKAKRVNKAAKKDEKVSYGDIIAVALFIAIIVSPSVAIAITPFEMSEDWGDALLWLRDNTEQTSYYLNPGSNSKPEYSVMSWWDYGNWIVYVSKRPVVCNNFQAGAVDAAKFFIAQDESAALEIAKRRGVRYVITDEMMGAGNETRGGKFWAIMRIAPVDPDLMTGEEIWALYLNSTFYKLHFEDARELEHFKLIADFDEVKIFEIVFV